MIGAVVPVDDVVVGAVVVSAPISVVGAGFVVSATAMSLVSPVAAVGMVSAETWPRPPAGAVEVVGVVVETVGFVGAPVSADVTTGLVDVSVVDDRT